MSAAYPSTVCHPALEALDAAASGLPRETFEDAVMWLAVGGLLQGPVEIEPPNGVPASSRQVLGDLYNGLVRGRVRFDGERFHLTRAGVQCLEAAGVRASDAARAAADAIPASATVQAAVAASLA